MGNDAFVAPPGTLPTREVSKVIADILMQEMSLDDAHCLLGDQEWDIPADRRLFVVVFDDAGPVVGACTILDQDPTSATYGQEMQQSTVMHSVRVEIMSFDNEARLRKEEVGLALQSFAAQNAMGQYHIGIGRPQVPVNATATEETGRLFRYVTRVNVTALHQKIMPPSTSGFYDKFNGATVDGTANPPQVNTEQ